jgi:hypothetical protein
MTNKTATNLAITGVLLATSGCSNGSPSRDHSFEYSWAVWSQSLEELKMNTELGVDGTVTSIGATSTHGQLQCHFVDLSVEQVVEEDAEHNGVE